MAAGNFTLSAISTVTTLLNHLLTVSGENYKSTSRFNAKYFAYDGFNAMEILSTFLITFRANSNDADAFQDLCDIVNIGLTRGNIRVDQLEKTSKNGKTRIQELAKKYNIMMRKGRNDKLTLTNSTMTFTRAISVFPYVASQLLSIQSCIPDINGCKFGSDKLPAAFKHSGFASLIPTGNDYCTIIFQCYVAYMISFGRKINPNNKDDDKTWYEKQKQFSTAAWNNLTLYTNESRIAAFKNLNINSHTMYGELYLTIANNLRKSIGIETVTLENLAVFTEGEMIKF